MAQEVPLRDWMIEAASIQADDVEPGTGTRHVQFDLGVAPASGKKEAAVLSDASLVALSREVAPVGTTLAMVMNVPTITLILIKLRLQEKNCDDSKLASEFLLYWKQMRATVKDKEKVAELERALRYSGKPELADVFADRHKDNLELTADCFVH